MSAAIGQAGAKLPEDSRDALNALEAGAEVLGAISDLRSLAFEIAAGLPEDAINTLADAEFDLAWVSEIVGLDLLMIDGLTARDPSLALQTGRVVRAFCQLVLGQRGGLNIVRDQITPAGWVVLIAILVQIIPVRQRTSSARPALWQMNAGASCAEAALKDLLEYFASSSEASANAPNWPWDVFEQLLMRRPGDLPLLLRQITNATGISVSNEVSMSNPRTGDNQGDRPIVRLTG